MAKHTKNDLLCALRRVMATKPLRKITISDITTECGVNRMTFYYHFKDLQDLLEWWLTDLLSASLFHVSVATWKKDLLQVFSSARAEQEVLLKLYHSIETDHVIRYLQRITGSAVQAGLAQEVGDRLTPEDLRLLSNVFAAVFIGTFIQWMEEDMREDETKLVKRLGLILQNTLAPAVERLHANTAGSLSGSLSGGKHQI